MIEQALTTQEAIQSKSIMSVSLDLEAAMSFGHERYKDDKVPVIITIIDNGVLRNGKKYAAGAFIKSISNRPMENELIFKHGQRFKVIGFNAVIDENFRSEILTLIESNPSFAEEIDEHDLKGVIYYQMVLEVAYDVKLKL